MLADYDLKLNNQEVPLELVVFKILFELSNKKFNEGASNPMNILIKIITLHIKRAQEA